MAIGPLKFVAITSKVGPAIVDIELSIPVASSNFEQVISSTENGVATKTLTFPPFVSEDPSITLTLNDFDLYVSSMDEGTSALLLKSIYVFDNSSGKLLLAIPNWPQTLWIKKAFGPVAGGIGVPKINLGDVAKVLSL